MGNKRKSKTQKALEKKFVHLTARDKELIKRDMRHNSLNEVNTMSPLARHAYYAQRDKDSELELLAASMSGDRFYSSPEWKQTRYQVLKEYGTTCMACGASPRTGATIQVDHIKPRSIFPELAFDFNNLQVLCKDCNFGKGNKDMTDWRDPGAMPAVILKKKAS